ncbi:MAG: hypothetical protein HZB99_00595 [Candidatus Harrisonbacteria bacterium]|nr:hypothetical protein [Candidatus Harrisonbacteria bacterium]
MRKGHRGHLYLAQYGFISFVTQGEIIDFSIEKIYAPNDNAAVEQAENRAEVLDVLENLKPDLGNITQHVILVSVRNQRNKGIIHFCGRLSGD